MSLKISLVYPPKKFNSQTLGLPYIAAALEKEGYQVDLVDSTALDWGFDEIRDYFKREKPDVVGVGNLFTPDYANCVKTCEIAKEESPECFTVVGGVHAFLRPSDFHSPSVDAIAACEGEYFMAELLDALQKGSDFKGIPGAFYRNSDGSYLQSPARRPIENLDAIPFPARHLLPMEKYSERISPLGEKAIGIVASRGCCFECVFCAAHKIFGRRERFRSADNIVEEIKEVTAKYKRRGIIFYNSNFSLTKSQGIELSKKILEEKLDIVFECNSRVTGIDKELLYWMKKAGCVAIDFGIESGDDKILADLRKHINTKQIKTAIDSCHEAGVLAGGSIMLGHATDSIETILKSIWFGCTSGMDLGGFTPAVPFPGTEFWTVAKKQGRLFTEDLTRFYCSPQYSGGVIYSPPDVPPEDLKTLTEIGQTLVKFGNKRLLGTFLKALAISRKRNALNNPLANPVYAAVKTAGALGVEFFKSVKNLDSNEGRRKNDCMLSFFAGKKFEYRDSQGRLFSIEKCKLTGVPDSTQAEYEEIIDAADGSR